MRKLVVGILLIVLLLVAKLSLAAERQRPFRIGALTDSWGPSPTIVGLRDGLLELGYREDEDFYLGVRFTQGDITALPIAAHELVQSGVDLIFASNTTAAKAAQRVTSRIPIVFASGIDPVKMGLVKSFARPGGNITGVSIQRIELTSKRLEIFQKMVPDLKRILYPYDATDAPSEAVARLFHDAARRLGMALVKKAVRSEEEARATLAHVRKDDVNGIVQPPTPSMNIPGLILETAARQGIPTMSETAFWVERGALASYGSGYHESGRQAARLVDKILKGANPAELPVEVNSKIEFAINLKTAKALGLTIPPEILYRADRVIR